MTKRIDSMEISNMKNAWKRTALVGALAALAASQSACVGGNTVGAEPTLGVADISDAKLDFGFADCGGVAPAEQTVVLKNTGSGPLRWAATVTESDRFVLTGDRSGAIDEGKSVTITVAAKAMPSSATAGDVAQAKLLVTTDDPAKPEAAIPLQATAHGARFEVLAPSVADFGKVPSNTAAPEIPVTLRNAGNAAAKVAVTTPSGSPFSFAWTGGSEPAEVAPGTLMAGLVAQFTPTSNVAEKSVGLIDVDGPVCTGSAKSIAVRGEGLGGTVGFSPGTVDYGKVGCNTDPGQKVLTIFNSGNLVFTFQASLQDGTRYALSKSTGAIAPGDTFELTVTPTPMGATTEFGDNAFGDVLTVTTSIPGDEPHQVPIKMSAMGAILKWTPGALDFGEIPAFQESPQGKIITVTNEGNAPAKVTIGGVDAFKSDEATIPGNGGTANLTLKYTALNIGKMSAKVGILTEDPICQDLPSTVVATGTGKAKAQAIAVGGPYRYNQNNPGQGGCVLLKDSGGRVACFGNNNWGQLGAIGGSGTLVIPNLKDVVQVRSSGNFACALDQAGDVWCWGANVGRNNQRRAQLGVENIDYSAEPLKIEGLGKTVQIDTGHNMACALSDAGTVSCWGGNRRGNIGTGNSSERESTPSDIGITGAKSIVVNGGGGCAMRTDGTVSCWGRMHRGNLGDGSCCDGNNFMPRDVNGIGDAQMLMGTTGAARGGSRCVLRSFGEVWCWGNGRRGQLNNNMYDSPNVPNPYPSMTPGQVKEFGGYNNGGCMLLTDKTVWCWGRNRDGQVGSGRPMDSHAYFAEPVANLSDVETIGTGGRGACAVTSDGSVKCWGNWGAGSSITPKALPGF